MCSSDLNNLKRVFDWNLKDNQQCFIQSGKYAVVIQIEEQFFSFDFAHTNTNAEASCLNSDLEADFESTLIDVVNVTSSKDQTNNVLSFYAPITSSSYAVFDSGYKWTWDRYNNKFRWMPTNPDIAGLMVRTDIEQFPWFSPAGQQRGNLNNSVKLAYNPTKAQRDQLYENRINPITNLPGQGSVLFGDKTGLSYASAFDRINVRRLFITVESALQGVANAQLFEFNDEITRSNFVNIVEPYLRDVQAKRGLIDMYRSFKNF